MPSPKNTNSPPPNSQPGRRTVLIVDDEESIVRLGKRILEVIGFTVLEAWSAKTALSVLEEKESQVELVITDLKMPGAGGAELAREIAEHHPNIKLVIMSGRGDLAGEAAKIGPHVGFISKPFQLKDLREIVSKTLGDPPSAE